MEDNDFKRVPNKRKGYRLFTYSVACAVTFAAGTLYFPAAKHANADRIEAENMGLLENYVKQGLDGDLPNFKPTGDPNIDRTFQYVGQYYASYLPACKALSQQFTSLNEMDASVTILKTNKNLLESEIQKRITAQQLALVFYTNQETILNNFQTQCESTAAPDTITKAITKLAPQYAAAVNSWADSQKAEQTLLQFLYQNFDDYTIQGQTIHFRTPANNQKYRDLAKATESANAKVQEIGTQAYSKLDAAKADLTESKN